MSYMLKILLLLLQLMLLLLLNSLLSLLKQHVHHRSSSGASNSPAAHKNVALREKRAENKSNKERECLVLVGPESELARQAAPLRVNKLSQRQRAVRAVRGDPRTLVKSNEVFLRLLRVSIQRPKQDEKRGIVRFWEVEVRGNVPKTRAPEKLIALRPVAECFARDFGDCFEVAMLEPLRRTTPRVMMTMTVLHVGVTFSVSTIIIIICVKSASAQRNVVVVLILILIMMIIVIVMIVIVIVIIVPKFAHCFHHCRRHSYVFSWVKVRWSEKDTVSKIILELLLKALSTELLF